MNISFAAFYVTTDTKTFQLEHCKAHKAQTQKPTLQKSLPCDNTRQLSTVGHRPTRMTNTKKGYAYSRVSKGIFTACSSQNRTWTARFIRLFKMPRPISKLALNNCLDKHFNHRLRLFCVHQFYILCTPSLLLTLISYQHYYGYIRPCG